MNNLPNIHPGEVLPEAFLQPLAISQNPRARAAGLPAGRSNKIVLGKRDLAADIAIRPAGALATSAHCGLGLQADYELEKALRALGKSVATIEWIAA